MDTESSSVDLHKKPVVDMFRIAPPCILFLFSLLRLFLAIDAHLFNKLVSKIFGDFHECYVAELAEDFRSIDRLDSNGSRSSLLNAVTDHVPA